jgi:hypothetical protein
MGIKNAEFNVDFEYGETVAKNVMQKSYQGKGYRKWSFSFYYSIPKFFGL